MPYKNKKDRSINATLRQYAIKMKCHEYLGGKCKHCGEDDFFKLCFHHLDPNQKEITISRKITSGFETLKPELDKCILLCNNCHRELHHEQIDILGENHLKRKHTKEIYLKFLNSFSCELCGYNKCLAALEFHHKNGVDKLYNICDLVSRQNTTIEDVANDVIIELSKCQILCRNCHIKHHANVEFFNSHKCEIELRYKNYKPMHIKATIEKVIDLYNKGLSLGKISKMCNCSKVVISNKIKMLIKSGQLKKRDKTWVNQFN